MKIESGNPADAFEWAVKCAACKQWVPIKPYADMLDALDAHSCQEMTMKKDEEPIIKFRGPERGERAESWLDQAIDRTSEVVAEMEEGLRGGLDSPASSTIIGRGLVKMMGLAIQFYVATSRRL